MAHRIFQIDPSSRVSVAEADRHYETIHSPFARQLILAEAPWVRRYAWNRVQASRDLAGGFRLRPSAWRFVLMELAEPGREPGQEPGQEPGREPGQEQSVAVLPAVGGRQLLEDHTRFLTNMRPYDVDRRVRLDRRIPSSASAKFMVTYDATASRRSREIQSAHESLLAPALTELLAGAVGARLYATNAVSAEAETAPIEEPGQQYTGHQLPEPWRAGIDELYFDNHLAGFEFFEQPAVGELLGSSELGRVQAHWVREWVAVDRT